MIVGTSLSRIKRVRESQRILSELGDQRSNVLLIHYSCESLYDRADGTSPRITSIAVKSLSTGQAHSFSIHKIAELQGVAQAKIMERYDRLELAMLKEFFEFVRTHAGYRWLHWNMRDMNFGFAAIEHRYRLLGGEPVVLDDSLKVDLSSLLVTRFGDRYINHPRLETLMRKNAITDLDFLTGKDEASAFETGNYVRLHQSTLRKVDVINSIFDRVAAGSLRTNSSWWSIYGFTPEAVAEWIKEHWLATIVTAVVGIIGLILAIVKL